MDIWFLVFILAVAAIVAVGCSLLLVGYLGTLPASFDSGWHFWLPAMLLPIIGPFWFAARHWADFARPGKQLLGGVLLLALAVGLLYGAGPFFVDRMAAAAQ